MLGSQWVLRLQKLNDVKTLVGSGLTGEIEGLEVAVGNLDLIRSITTSIPPEVEAEISEKSASGSNVILVSRDRNLIGWIEIRDTIRKIAISNSKNAGHGRRCDHVDGR